MSCGWEHSRTLTPAVSARRLVLAADMKIAPPFSDPKSSIKTNYFKYLKPIEQRFHLKQHMTRENSQLGSGKLFFTGDQLRINRSGFEYMFDDKRPPVMVTQQDGANNNVPVAPSKQPGKGVPNAPQLFWCFLSSGSRLSKTPSMRSSGSLRSVPRSRSMPPDDRYYVQRAQQGTAGPSNIMINSGTNTIDSRMSADTTTHTYGPIEVDTEVMLDGQMGTVVEHSRFADIRELREQVEQLSAYENAPDSRMTTSSTMSNVMQGDSHGARVEIAQ